MHREIIISYSRKDLDIVKSIKEEFEREMKVERLKDLNNIESGSPQYTEGIVDGINIGNYNMLIAVGHDQHTFRQFNNRFLVAI